MLSSLTEKIQRRKLCYFINMNVKYDSATVKLTSIFNKFEHTSFTLHYLDVEQLTFHI